MRYYRGYKYCPRCQGTLQPKKGLRICRACDLEFYLEPKSSATVILKNERGRILLAKRKRPPRANYWGLPGGFLEADESFEEGIGRELKEELGIAVKNLSYFGSYPDTYLYQGILYPVVNVIFHGKIKGNARMRTADDISNIAFFDPRKLPFQKIAFTNIKRALREFVKLPNSKSGASSSSCEK